MDNDLMTMNTVADRMEIIKTVFQDAKDYAEAVEDTNELLSHLENTNPEFRSVAYEGASMALALKDFVRMDSFGANDNSLKRWNAFMNVSENHAAQVYIGLGWAAAQEKRAALSFMNTHNPVMQLRVWDGCGYYDGIFRQRHTVKSQIRHDYIPENSYTMYDQGLGRCLWYLCKGDETKIPEMIKQFSSSRHPDLWRGLGIACAYVGGCDAMIFKTLSASAGQDRTQLGIGAAMAAKARILANSVTKDIELACNAWCDLSAQDAMHMAVKTETSAGSSFTTWLLQMETEMQKKVRS